MFLLFTRISAKVHFKSLTITREEFVKVGDRNKCRLCDFECKALNTMEGHINKIHKGTSPHVCEHCGRTFTNWLAWNGHLHRAHIGDWPSHSNEQKHLCNCCGKLFSYQALKRHLQDVSESNESLRICSTFLEYNQLT